MITHLPTLIKLQNLMHRWCFFCFVNILLAMAVASTPLLAFALDKSDPTKFYSNFTDVSLVDQDNQAFQVTKLAGKVTLYNFIFTHCSNVCPIQTRQLSDIQKSLSAETRQHVQFVSVSLDPYHDSPAALKAFAKNHGVDFNGWSFVMGDEQGIKSLSEKLSLYDKRKAAEQPKVKRPDGHMTHLWLVNGEGQLMQRYNGSNIDKKRIASEISTLVSMKPALASKSPI